MNEILLSNDARASQVESTSARRAFWTAAMVPCFAGSAASLAVGLTLSGLSAAGLIHVSRLVAYLAVGFLLAAFVLSFLGAHCMDRRVRPRRPNE